MANFMALLALLMLCAMVALTLWGITGYPSQMLLERERSSIRNSLNDLHRRARKAGLLDDRVIQGLINEYVMTLEILPTLTYRSCVDAVELLDDDRIKILLTAGAENRTSMSPEVKAIKKEFGMVLTRHWHRVAYLSTWTGLYFAMKSAIKGRDQIRPQSAPSEQHQPIRPAEACRRVRHAVISEEREKGSKVTRGASLLIAALIPEDEPRIALGF